MTQCLDNSGFFIVREEKREVALKIQNPGWTKFVLFLEWEEVSSQEV
jgi:hypothetical protein